MSDATSPILEVHWIKVTQAFDHDVLDPFLLMNSGEKKRPRQDVCSWMW